MTKLSSRRKRIQRASDATIAALKAHVSRGDGLCIVKAPPGSGKTFTLSEALGQAVEDEARVAVAAQTNAQCDDICGRYIERYPSEQIWRFAAGSARMPDDIDPRILWITGTNELPVGPAVVVGTTAKWSTIGDFDPFDFLFVDEAWQMAWADFMLLGSVSERFVLIGDPGQIPPVVSIPVERWETSPRAPHRAAPDLILDDPTVPKLALELDACRRLPADSVDLVQPFYDFRFDAWAEPGERFVRPTKGARNGVDPSLDLLATYSAAILTLPTPSEGPPLELDPEIADLAARVAVRALERKCEAANDDSGKGARLEPRDIGIAATHRVMNSAILGCLPARYRDQEAGIRVDTPERWQGLERKLMIVVHPLSGVVHPSDFNLETGRLCVMASRHQSGMVIISRDHVPETLATHIPWAEQAVGRPDVAGRGHHQNSVFWEAMETRGAVVACK
jgi:hypothetical protein